jgi:hypothetical protein
MLAPARKTVLGLVLAASLFFALGSAHAAPSCVTGATTTTCTFSYTGAAEAWVVPAGVTSAVFDVYGGAGGSLASMLAVTGGPGGRGAHVQATVALTPGATLNMRIGGQGTDGFASPTNFTGTLAAAGGFNGGGTNSITCTICSFVLGGAGGGSSDVRTSADGLADRLLVAGGGGGAGGGGPNLDLGSGGDSATAAKDVTDGFVSCSGGGAGTLVGPGPAGGGPDCFPGSPGDPGGLNGGGTTLAKVGAGGGGYFGGGAGAVGDSFLFVETGGGGGSNYPNPLSPPAGISSVTIANGVQSGNGLITVTYATPSAVNFASASATRTARGVLLRWRTGTEADLLGFHVYRSREHSWQRITRSLIAAKGFVSGASYRYLDRTARHGVSYRYRIRAVHSDGTATWFDPVHVT